VQMNQLIVAQIDAIDRVRADIKALRIGYPEKNIPESVLSSTRSVQELFNDASSIVGNEEFVFDDELVNSQAYRRVLAAAMRHQHQKFGSCRPPHNSAFQDSSTVVQKSLDSEDSQRLRSSVATLMESAAISFSDRPLTIYQEMLLAIPEGNGTEEISLSLPPPPSYFPLSSKNSSGGNVTTNNMPDKISRLGDKMELAESDINGTSPQAASNELEKRRSISYRFAKYIIGKTIASRESEDWCRVKEAWRTDNTSVCAIKFWRRPDINWPNRSSYLLQMHREIRILQDLDYHPHVIRLLEIIENNNYIGLVMRYTAGGKLRHYINHYIKYHRYLQDDLARRIFAQLISGVRYLHLKGIAHLNITPENILLDENRNVIIGGFGGATTFSHQEESLHESPSIPVGELRAITVPYTDPSLLTGKKLSYKLADIWSCGIILVGRPYGIYGLQLTHIVYDARRVHTLER